ncbi:hypothetical protein THUN1379_30840 [Paludibacterium sp. THUN1379]|uniref:GNAT family N-acetyltransferase n=1 Tax=Paludibacterium sp. THUN1379 TaxID=3112107 RepID=UPI00308EAEC8|nr:hypothetical protein THUN1379_30840 [Paludibacterium sp. THUN1379]
MLIEALDLSSKAVATTLLAVHRAAYLHEAALLGRQDFPPLQVGLEVLQATAWQYRGAWQGARLLGALAIEPDPDGGWCIASLVVDPGCHRQGVARALMQSLLADCPRQTLHVQTALANQPALSLYQDFGFVEVRRWCVGEPPLSLVRLIRRHPASGDSHLLV